MSCADRGPVCESVLIGHAELPKCASQPPNAPLEAKYSKKLLQVQQQIPGVSIR